MSWEQSVEHMVEFRINEDDGKSSSSHYKINARDFFVPTQVKSQYILRFQLLQFNVNVDSFCIFYFVFLLQDDWVILTADYCQIELRLMAHFSKDNSLIELLSNAEADIFSMVAAKWRNKHESSVSSQDREQTKKLVYGILYGMGPNTLAEQLECSADEAAERIQNFKKSFPGVASWLHEAVSSCRKKG